MEVGISNENKFQDQIFTVLSENHLEYSQVRNQITVKKCPFCPEGTDKVSNQNKLGIDLEGKRFNCFRCEASGTLNQFVKMIGASANNLPREQSKKANKDVERIKSAQEFWDKSVIPPGWDSIVEKYFIKRGLTVDVIEDVGLKVSYNQPFYIGSELKGKFPCIVAKVVNMSGDLTAVHRTYLDKEGNKAPFDDVKRTKGPRKGGAIRLSSEVGDTLCLAEGLETALSVKSISPFPVWSTLTADGMESVELPDNVTTVYIWGDKDRSKRGEIAAHKLAERLAHTGKTVFVLIPKSEIPSKGKSIDWLDEFCKSPEVLADALKMATPFTSNESRFTLNKETEFPSPLQDEAYFGIAGKLVKKIEPITEADEAAILIQFLISIGCYFGNKVSYMIGASKHSTNLFGVLVGNTASARKGTSWSYIKKLLREVDENWSKSRIISGFASGESIINSVRDPKTKVEEEDGIEKEKVVDAGEEDKRLLVVEEEFASLLKIASRESNTITAVLRSAWDGSSLFNTSKHSAQVATDPHISIVGHITKAELTKSLSVTDCLNGFGNRFLWAMVQRSKVIAFPKKIDPGFFEDIRLQLLEAVLYSQQIEEIVYDEEFKMIWESVYPALEKDRDDLYGKLVGRADATICRLSALYALLDKSMVMRKEHLLAAIAVWEYCDESCKYLFGTKLGNKDADKILEALKDSDDGLRKDEIRNLFSRHKSSSELEKVMRKLKELGLVESFEEKTSGRPATRFKLKT